MLIDTVLICMPTLRFRPYDDNDIRYEQLLFNLRRVLTNTYFNLHWSEMVVNVRHISPDILLHEMTHAHQVPARSTLGQDNFILPEMEASE